MKKSYFLILVLISNQLRGICQDSIYNKHSAIQIIHLDSLDENIYRAIASYQLIMVGEMHGTSEPAGFVLSLTNLFTRKGIHVQVGIEIPSDQMERYLSNPTDSNIYYSDFFAHKRLDDRASLAWANLIARVRDNVKAEIFFFDINTGEIANIMQRDSLMYLKIKKRIQLHPTWMTITLSGNIHNMLLPFNGEPKIGIYILRDNDLNMKNKTLSINHIYPTDHTNPFFEHLVGYENYLYLYPRDANLNFSGIYFTSKCTFSHLISKE